MAFRCFVSETLSGIPGVRRFGGADYLWPCRDDAFVFADFTRPDPARLFSMLNAADGARHLFLVTHGTVAPPDAWGPYWFLFGEPDLAEARRELFARLLRLNAIVLCGHLHRVALRRWERLEGTLVEFCANSVWREGEETPTPVFDGPGNLGSYMRETPPPVGEDYDGRRQTRTAEELRAMVEEYRDGLVEWAGATNTPSVGPSPKRPDLRPCAGGVCTWENSPMQLDEEPKLERVPQTCAIHAFFCA